MYAFGYETVLDPITGQECYVDTHEPISIPSRRPCPQCHRLPTAEGHDPCLGTIPGAISACCGHGVENGYIVWKPAAVMQMDVDAPRWLRWALWLLGFGSFLSGRKPAVVQIRHEYPVLSRNEKTDYSVLSR